MQNWKTFSEAKNNRVLVIDDNPQIHADFRNILCTEFETGFLDRKETLLFGEAYPPLPEAPVETFELDSAFQGQQGLEMVLRALPRLTDSDRALPR